MNVVKAIEEQGTKQGKPLEEVLIKNCGEIGGKSNQSESGGCCEIQ